jgi:tetratricopeptide (TPR) repeat protein
VKDTSVIDPGQFVAAVQPLLERRDVGGLCRLLESRWSCDQLRTLLHSDHLDAKKVALLAVGLVGTPCVAGELAVELRHPDKIVNEMAEHALWSVWFRGGSPAANHELARGAQALERRDFPHAIGHFDRAIAESPDFAEAYNQRALAHYLMENYEPSIADGAAAVERMPCHFGALAGMGHCYAHLGKPREAVESYRRALEVNPHLDCVRQAIDEIERGLSS